MAKKHVREMFDELRQTPSGYSFSAFALLIAYELLRERTAAWANTKIDSGGGAMFSYLHDSLVWSSLNPAAFIWSFVGIFVLIVFTRAALKPSAGAPPMPPPSSETHLRPLAGPIRADTPIAPQTVPKDRIYVQITPAELVNLFAGRTNHEANKLFEVYTGKWMSVVGPLNDVTITDSFILVYFMIEGAKILGSIVRCKFSIEAKNDVSHLKVGDRIRVDGEIESGEAMTLKLTRCELVTEASVKP